MHYFRAPMHEAAGPGQSINRTKFLKFLSVKLCILAPSGLTSGTKQNKTNPGEFDAKIILNVTLTKCGQHCPIGIAPKIGGAVADPAAPVPVLLYSAGLAKNHGANQNG